MNPVSLLYYRYMYLRENSIARAVTSLLGRPEVPSREIWESQYRTGHWTRLNDLSEQAHNAMVLSYVSYLRPNSSLLEIGCGEGILLQQLKKIGYRSYTGVDISQVAIDRCSQFRDVKTSFIACNAEMYVPDGNLDVMIFNESAYYFARPILTLQRYAEYLTAEGIFVISLFDMERTRPIRRQLKRVFSVVDETLVVNRGGKWHCLVLTPRLAKNAI